MSPPTLRENVLPPNTRVAGLTFVITIFQGMFNW